MDGFIMYVKWTFSFYFSLKEHYQIDDDTSSLIKISEIYDEFCQSFPSTSAKAFGMSVRKAFPSIKKKNNNSIAFYTNIKRIVDECKYFKFIYYIYRFFFFLWSFLTNAFFFFFFFKFWKKNRVFFVCFKFA